MEAGSLKGTVPRLVAFRYLCLSRMLQRRVNCVGDNSRTFWGIDSRELVRYHMRDARCVHGTGGKKSSTNLRANSRAIMACFGFEGRIFMSNMSAPTLSPRTFNTTRD